MQIYIYIYIYIYIPLVLLYHFIPPKYKYSSKHPFLKHALTFPSLDVRDQFSHLCKTLYTIVGLHIGAGIAQSVLCLTTDWTNGRTGFDPRQRRMNFSL
jgi:hypothetical protein